MSDIRKIIMAHLSGEQPSQQAEEMLEKLSAQLRAAGFRPPFKIKLAGPTENKTRRLKNRAEEEMNNDPMRPTRPINKPNFEEFEEDDYIYDNPATYEPQEYWEDYKRQNAGDFPEGEDIIDEDYDKALGIVNNKKEREYDQMEWGKQEALMGHEEEDDDILAALELIPEDYIEESDLDQMSSGSRVIGERPSDRKLIREYAEQGVNIKGMEFIDIYDSTLHRATYRALSQLSKESGIDFYDLKEAMIVQLQRQFPMVVLEEDRDMDYEDFQLPHQEEPIGPEDLKNDYPSYGHTRGYNFTYILNRALRRYPGMNKIYILHIDVS